MSDENLASDPSELEPLTDVTETTTNKDVSPSARLTVSFDTDHQPEGGGDLRPRGYSQNRRSSMLEESWRRRDSSTRIMDANKFISFHNIVYQVPVKKWFREKSKKVVLHGVSGVMRTGLNAIMGPSGSGKTSLLDILADRKKRDHVSGYVLINGEKQPQNFKCAAGYVVQDDMLSGTLTVRENIALSAALRLPRDISRGERSEKVDEIIEELNLSHVAKSKIGNQFIRGVSGGQRKRTSIAMEMIVSPAILFLDEPTTGLDATTALSVIRLLYNLSKEGRIIVMSIHQPRYSIFRLFDHLTLLSRGEIVYHGKSKGALPYFSGVLKMDCEDFDNPADFFLDKVVEVEKKLRAPDQYYNSVTGEVTSVHPLAKQWKESSLHDDIQKELDPILDQAIDQPEALAPRYATSLPTQFGLLSVRAVKNLVRDPGGAIAVAVQNIVLAIMTGIIYLQLEDDANALINRSGALFFAIICNMFAATSSLELFITERALFVHENSNGFYRVSAYFLSKVLMDLIPLRLLFVPVYSAIAYWMVGLRTGADHFFFFIVTLIGLSSAGVCVVFCIGAVIGVFTVAQNLYSLVFTFSLVFTGYLISLDSIPVWLNWLQWISIFRYAFAALTENELKDRSFCAMSSNNTCVQELAGNEYLEELDFLKYNVWFNVGALFVYALIMLFIAYLALLFTKKDK